jgi:hypothetical protein
VAAIGVRARLLQWSKVLLPICGSEILDQIVRAAENPLQFPLGVIQLESLIGRLGELHITTEQLNPLKVLLEDELIGMKLICQDARCDPTRCSTSHKLDEKFQE